MDLLNSVKLMSLATLSAMTIGACKEKQSGVDTDRTPSDYHQAGKPPSNSSEEAARSADNNGSKTAQNHGLESAISTYLALKDALVADDENTAAKAGKSLATELEGVVLSNGDQQELMSLVERSKSAALQIPAGPIDQQRRHFETVSKNLIAIIEKVGTEQALYRQFCPMYNQNTGGVWLSSTEAIQNPYFGGKMLKCGVVQEVYN